MLHRRCKACNAFNAATCIQGAAQLCIPWIASMITGARPTKMQSPAPRKASKLKCGVWACTVYGLGTTGKPIFRHNRGTRKVRGVRTPVLQTSAQEGGESIQSPVVPNACKPPLTANTTKPSKHTCWWQLMSPFHHEPLGNTLTPTPGSCFLRNPIN